MSTSEPRETRPDRRYVPWYKRCVPSRRTVIVIVTLLLMTPVGVRKYRLWRMPDVPVPFDVDEFSEQPLDEDNAFYYFRLAANQHQFGDFSNEAQIYEPNGKIYWSHVPEELKQWVAQQQVSLALFRQGGRCSSASDIPPALFTNSTYSTNLRLIQSLRDLHRLARLDAVRLMDQGQTAEAAELLHDSFRATRHLGRRGSFIDRLTGMGLHELILDAWRQWSRHPDVTAEEIEAALARLREDWKLTPPASDNFKMEYFAEINFTESPQMEWRNLLDDWLDSAVTKSCGLRAIWFLMQLDSIIPGWQIPFLWTVGEPEVSARAIRLKLKHTLKYCDLPYADLPPLVEGGGTFRETTEQTAGLTASQLHAQMRKSLLYSMVASYGFFPEQFLGTIRREAARQALFETELGLQAQFRRQGVLSRADVERLLTNFPWPIDPCSAQRQPIQFRAADEGLVIWSVGPDGIDQGGEIVENGTIDDVIAVIPWPTDN